MAGLVLMGVSMARRLMRGGARLHARERRERRREFHYHAPRGRDARFAVRSARISSSVRDGQVVYYHIIVDDGGEGWELERRFADFVDARDAMLIKNDPCEFKLNPLCPFPSKNMNNKNFHISPLTETELEQRRVALERWLNERIDMVQRKYTDPECVEANNLRHTLYRIEAELAFLLGVNSASLKRTPVRKPSFAVEATHHTLPAVMAEPVLEASPVVKHTEPTAPPLPPPATHS